MGQLGREHWTARAARNELAPCELVAGSLPTQREETPPWGTRDRRYTCGRYNDCLNYAVRAKWKSWDCEGCKVREEMSTEQAAMDAERIPLLVLKAFVPRKDQVQRGAYARVHRVSRGRIKVTDA
jgi:hypothetical protein